MYFRCIMTNYLGSKEMFSNISMFGGICWWYHLMGCWWYHFHEMEHIWILILTTLLLNWGPTHLGKVQAPYHFWNLFINWDVYVKVVVGVKLQCASIVELDNCFPSDKLMNALRVVYPHYWMGPKPKTSFWLHLNVIKDVYCVQKKCGFKEV
jgi:hypothetical protein